MNICVNGTIEDLYRDAFADAASVGSGEVVLTFGRGPVAITPGDPAHTAARVKVTGSDDRPILGRWVAQAPLLKGVER